MRLRVDRNPDIAQDSGSTHRASPRSDEMCSKKELTMADDDRDFIERAESVNEKLNGKPMPVDEMAEKFALYGLKKRADALESFDAELRGEIGSGSHSLRRHVELMELRKKMRRVHEALRKAKR
jgi:hypothetical protein